MFAALSTLELLDYVYFSTEPMEGAEKLQPIAPGASAEGSSLLQREPLKAAQKRCKGVTRNGAACTAWAMEGGLCYFHANPDKAVELGRNGAGTVSKPTSRQRNILPHPSRRPM